MDEAVLAGRTLGEVYSVSRREDLHAFLVSAVEASGGRVIYVSDPDKAPVYLGVQLDSDERMGMLIYPFRITQNQIRNRPSDEVRGQLRYGSEGSWGRDHPIWRDTAGVDVTLVLGVDPIDEVIVGLDATLWDPLPMGISFYCKKAEMGKAKQDGWHVWEKANRGGSKRSSARSPTNLETVVAFTSDRLIDFARLQRQSTSLRLDSALRHSVATAMTQPNAPQAMQARHVLEEKFDLTSQQILDIIIGRNRLSVAVRGGVAEHHLERHLRDSPGVRDVQRLDKDAEHDFDVTMQDGRFLRVECKNASPELYASGEPKVEVQKTRASKGDRASRFYAVDKFDVVAACLFSSTGLWEFRFGKTSGMLRHRDFPDRLAAIQKVTEDWTAGLADLTP